MIAQVTVVITEDDGTDHIFQSLDQDKIETIAKDIGMLGDMVEFVNGNKTEV